MRALLPLRVLILEDNPADAVLMVDELRQAGFEPQWQRVDTEPAFTAALESKQWDVILADYSLPNFNAPAALGLVQELGIDIPFIIVSGTVGEEVAVVCMKAGAHDFFAKDKLARLGPAVEREMREAEERRQRREAEKRLRQAEERFAKAFHSSPVGIAISHRDGRFLDVNEYSSGIFGYSPEEMIGRTSVELGIWANPDDRRRVVQLLREHRSIREVDIPCRIRSGEIRDMMVSFETITLGDEDCILTLFRDITERKRAEEALRESEARLRTVLENMPVMLDALDENLNIIVWNRECERVTGYSADEIIGHPNVSELLYPDPAYRERMQGELVASEDYRDWEWDTTCKDRSVRTIAWSNISRQYPIPGWSSWGIGIDITKRKQAEEELSTLYNATSYLFKADSLLNLGHQIVDAVVREFKQADCGLLLVDREQNRLIRLARAGANQVEAAIPLQVDGPGLVPVAIRTATMIYTPNVAEDPNYVAGDARTRSELVIPLRTASGVIAVLDLQSAELDGFRERDRRVLTAFAERAAAAIEIMRLYEEINQRAAHLEWRVAQRTAELQRAKEHVETILNNSTDAIILLDPDSIIQQANPAFGQVFGFTGEIWGKSLQAFVEPSEREKCAATLLMVTQQRQPARLELTCVRGDGTLFDADAALAHLAGDKDDDVQIICSLRDISQRKQLEAELREALAKEKELNELKSRFISMVSHEFRTPMATILSSSGLIRDYGDRLPAEKRLQHLDKIAAQIRRLTLLLEDVLTIGKADAKGTEFNPERVDLEAFCRDVLDEIRPTTSTHQIEFAGNGDCTQANIDPKLMRQVLYNLLSNAIKYSPDGNVVRLELLCSQDAATIRVIDQGIGIPEADQAHLFEVFHRAKNVGSIQGTGLGLAIVKRAVDAHRGSIVPKSEVGKGTTFIVTIPLVPPTGTSE